MKPEDIINELNTNSDNQLLAQQQTKEAVNEVSDTTDLILQKTEEIAQNTKEGELEIDADDVASAAMWSLLRGPKGEKGELGKQGDKGEKGDGIQLTPEEIAQALKGDEEFIQILKPNEDEIVNRVLQSVPTPKDGKKGMAGKEGKNGKNGRDADEQKIIKEVFNKIEENIKTPEVTAEDIVEKLSNLKDNSRLSYDSLKDTPNLNALGRQASRDYDLIELKDVSITSPTNGQVLTYNTTTQKWTNQTGGGTGTVTNVSVATANGLAGTVANPTTTPVITLSTTITGVLKGNGTAISTALNSDLPSMSSTVGGAVPTPPNNTTTFLRGDGTFATPPASSGTVSSVSSADGNATVATPTTTPVITIVSAPKLQTARTIGTTTGDATTAGSSFDGTGNNTNALTLATVNANVGTFGLAGSVAQFVVNAKGLITSAVNVAISITLSQISNFGTGVATALGINTGTAGSVVVNGGVLGTPSSGTATNLTGTASGLIAGNVTTNANLTGAVTSVGNATSLGSFTSAQLATALTDETGSGANVFGTNPTLVKPVMSATNPTAQTYTPASAGTATLDLSLSNQHDITFPAGNITIALSNDTNNQIFMVSLTQDATGSRTATFFTTIKWAGGTAPTLTTTANKRDLFGFKRTGASTYDGFIIGASI